MLIENKAKDSLIKFKMLKYFTYMQNNADSFANHILVLIAFFLSISPSTVSLFYTLILVLFVFKKEKLKSLKIIKDNYVILSLLLYIGLYYFGILFANETVSAYTYAKKTDFLFNIILISIFLQYKFIPRILAAYIMGVFVSELFSYALAFGVITGPFLGSFQLASHDNPSPFMHHIHYGFTLAFTSYLLLELIKNSHSLILKVISSFFLLSISINLILNVGRTGYVLYIIGICIFIILNYKRHSLKVIPISIIFVTLIFFLAYQFSPIFKSRIDQTTHAVTKIYHNSYKSSIGLRLEKYSQAFDLSIEKPLFGYGTGQHLKLLYQDAKEKNLWYADIIKTHPNLDSEYLDIVVQFGLLGLLIYLNLFYQAIKYKQTDIHLKNIQLVLVIFYILFSFEAVGVIHHALAQTFLFFMSITLVKKKIDEMPLEKISFINLCLYIFVGAIFFLRSKIHLGDPIKSFLHNLIV